MSGCRVLPTSLPAPFSATLSPALSVYLFPNVGLQGLLVVGLPARSSHTPPVSVPPRPHESLRPPTGLDECLFFISLVSVFLAVRFSVSSGCVRRRSVSTYTAILVLPSHNLSNMYMPLLNEIYRSACDLGPVYLLCYILLRPALTSYSSNFELIVFLGVLTLFLFIFFILCFYSA